MELNGNAEQEQIIDSLQKWFQDQPDLPNKINRILLTRFYSCMSKDIEETKKILKTHYVIRQSNPDIFTNRDPSDKDTRNTSAYADMIYLPGLTPEKCRVSIIRIKDPDPKLMHYAKDVKAFVMVSDGRFSLPDVVEGNTSLISDGDIQIVDMNNYTIGHLTRLSISALRTYSKYLQQAYPVRMKAMHIINCPSYLSKILAVVKPFISKDVYEMMHFHTTSLDTLYEYVPREMLPTEYGGSAGNMPDLMKVFEKTLQVKRDYIMDPNYWKTQKS